MINTFIIHKCKYNIYNKVRHNKNPQYIKTDNYHKKKADTDKMQVFVMDAIPQANVNECEHNTDEVLIFVTVFI